MIFRSIIQLQLTERKVKYRNILFHRLNVLDSLSYALASASGFIISSLVIPQWSIILTKYFPFSQLYVSGFEI